MIKLSYEEYKCAESDYTGYCRACGAERDSCEPDARNYECYECGENEVFGAPELLIMGELEITDE